MAKTTIKFKRDFIGYTLRLIYDVFNNNSTTNYLYFSNRIIKIEYLPFFFDIAKYKKTPTYPSGASDKDKDAMYDFFRDFMILLKVLSQQMKSLQYLYLTLYMTLRVMPL